MKIATCRLLTSLPPGLHQDSDIRFADGEVLVPRPGPKAYVCVPPAGCKVCGGRGYYIALEDGKRDRRACACVMRAVERAETPAVDLSAIEEPAAPGRSEDDRRAARLARIDAELATAQTRLDESVAAVARARAPHEARIAALEAEHADCLARLTAAQRVFAQATTIHDTADRAVHAAQERARETYRSLDDATVRLEAAAAAADPLLLTLASARRTLQTVASANGHRHRADVQRRRIEELQARRAAVAS